MDNRMKWILDMEEVEKVDDKDAYFTDYEICSEVQILGILDYGNGALRGCLFQKADKNGLYTYIIRIKNAFKNKCKFDKSNFFKNGYYFKDPIHELMAIFSVYFQARFFLKATLSGELTSKSVWNRYENSFRYIRPNQYMNFEMFTPHQERNWAHQDGLRVFLDRIKNIDQKYHQNLIRAFFWYADAIKEIGVDRQLFFIKMVSSIEALLKFLPQTQDKLEKKMKKIVNFTNEESKEIERWLENRKIRQRFALFLKKYSVGFCTGGKRKVQDYYIKKEKIGNYAKKIYDARSAYLHTGKPMYISDDMRMKEAKFWDLDPGMGMMADRRKFNHNEKLPRTRWFERIANFCLKKFMETHQCNYQSL